MIGVDQDSFLVVAITTIAVSGGHMHSSTAATVVGAAMLSTLIYPFVGLVLRRRDRPSQVDGPAARDVSLRPAVREPLLQHAHGVGNR